MLLQPILPSISSHVSESSPSDTDAYKVLRLRDFLATLLEHPLGKGLLLRRGTLETLTKVLDRSLVIVDGKPTPDELPVLSGIHYNARELDQKDDVDVNYNVPSMAG
ncbi:hypothetical protein KIW84_044600 [Lathyrus oleraceus]|uniref:Uncharacterized protein n=1 Tax=Pisum sativum TaxID=3888 RepID=A0A9D4XIV9_PEA|nr:hypothetical protein KIW84_044600 [Pisum sativum]